MSRNLLFVCSRNQIRSVTAERLCSRLPGYQTRSAGTASSARIRVNAGHIRWADVILTMEPRHTQQLRERFPAELRGKSIVCLDIPDVYDFMDPDLVEAIRSSLTALTEIRLESAN